MKSLNFVRNPVVLVLLAVFAFMLAMRAMAQLAPVEQPLDFGFGDISSWFRTPFHWAFMTFSVVGILKEHLLKHMHGLVSLGVAAAIGILGPIMGTLNVPVIGIAFEGTIAEAFSFGVAAFLIAAGGYDGLMQFGKKLLGKS